MLPGQSPASDTASDSLSLKIQHRPRLSLKALGRKARTHAPKQLNAVTASIRRFGFINPVLIDDSDHVLAGHARLAAAERLGMDHVPVVVVSHLTPAEKRAYVVADNRLAELGGWDKRILAAELKELRSLDLDFELTLTGLTEIEIDAIVFGDAAGLPPEVAPAEARPITPVSRPGDVWCLGPHRILCGDATQPASYARLMAGERARAVFTDPPYNCPIKGHVTSNASHREFPMAVGEMDRDGFTGFLSAALSGVAGVCEDGAVVFAAMDWRNLRELADAGERAELSLLNVCVWDKGVGGMGSLYRSQHELIFVFKAGSAKHQNNVELGRHGRNRTNVWSYPGANASREGRDDLARHPTPKPLTLVQDALLDCTTKGDIVLDPFSGGGATLTAAELTGRRARVMELDPGYVDAAVLRWEAQTGGTAVLQASGASLAATRLVRTATAVGPVSVQPPARVGVRVRG